MSLCLKGYFLCLRLTLTGEPVFTTGEIAEKEVEKFIGILKYHHDGKDLSKFPCIVYLDDAGRRISVHLDHGSAKGEQR